MNAANPKQLTQAATGAAMDRVIPRNPRQRWLKWGGVAVVTVALLALGWQLMPRGLSVKADEVEVATVTDGTFLDELVVHSTLAPLSSVMLDATEGGRVESVLVKDGALVKKGDLLFRLSNPQRLQEVLARSADVAQQLANLSSQRAALAASRASYRRDIGTQEYELEQVRKAHARNQRLAAQGFVSSAALEESADKLVHQQKLVEDAKADSNAELTTREQSIRQMDSAIEGLNTGLRLMKQAADGLSVRAPVDGRVTGFQLQEGESVKPGDRVGRVDSPDRFKLSASVDEFYLGRVATGLRSTVEIDKKTYALAVSRINPQVKDGHFVVELNFTDAAPSGLQAGQGVEARITLGQPGRALLIPDAAFYADTGGTWLFVLDAKGEHAERRAVRLGRRAAGRIEVLGGLRAGEQVVISSYRRFGDAQQLRFNQVIGKV